jgi:hypothetical protein
VPGPEPAARVDLDVGTVTVAEQLVEVNGAFFVGPPKSAAGRRTVTLPAVVVEALSEHLARYMAKSPKAFVFLSSQGKRRSWFVGAVLYGAHWR